MPLAAASPDVSPKVPAWAWIAGGLVGLALVFALDLQTPRGFAHGMLYAPLVLLALPPRSERGVLVLATVAMTLVVVGMVFSPGQLEGVADRYVAMNRFLAIIAIGLFGLAGVLGLRLRRRERRLRQALEDSAGLLGVASEVGKLGGWSVELPARTTVWSPQVFELFDLSPGDVPDVEAVIGMYLPEDQPRIRAAFEDCVQNGRDFDIEIRVPSRNHGRRWVRVVGRAVRDDAGRMLRVQGAIQDISRQKQSESAIERSQAEWQRLAESLPMMVWIAGEDGAVGYMNQYTADYTGAPAAELLGADWLYHVHPDDKPALLADWTEAVRTGRIHEAEFRVRRHDGEWRWHLGRAVRVDLPGDEGRRWYGTATDVQEMRRIRDERERLANRLSETMASVTDAIFMLDAQWRFTYLNPKAEQLLERSAAELAGSNVWEQFPQAVGTEFEHAYRRCLQDGVAVRFEAAYGPLDKLFEVNAYPAQDGIVVYFRDITDQRRLAEEVQKTQRLDSLGQLTGGVAHDFNNLLTVIMGNAEALVEQYGAEGQQRMLADMIGAAARRGAEMTQRLLAFARKQALEPRPADLNRLVRQVAPLLQRTLGGHIEVELVHAAGLWQTLVDPGQLEVALLNLAVNARDAMPDGGRLTIETANAHLDQAYTTAHGDLRPGQYVMLAVSDTGCGIPAKDLPRLFEPFFTTKEVGRGTGLGLPMVYGFVKQSQGHVSVYSEVGKGTTLRIYLPRLHQARDIPAEDAPEATGPRGQGQCVLLVEDDEMVRAYASNQVGALGYRVLEARDGPSALALLRSDPGIDLLFTDVVMPGGMSGRQLADAARALRPGLPVLYTSGYTENAIVHHGRLDPGVLLLGKPYRRAELAQKLAQALAQGGGGSPA